MRKKLPVCAALACAAFLCSCGGNDEEVTRPVRTSGETYTIPRQESSIPSAVTTVPGSVNNDGDNAENTDNGSLAEEFSCSDITARILENVSMPSMAEVGADRVGMYIDCEIPSGTDFSFYICGSGGFADEVCVIDISEIGSESFTDAVNRRIESRMNDFKDYNPDEYQKLSEMFIKQTGDYLIYAVTGDNGECERIFDEFTGG